MLFHEQLAGVEVARVLPGGFGDQCGLEPGDLLLELAGAPIFTMPDVWTITRSYGEGARVRVGYARQGELRTAEGVLGGTADFPQ